MFLNLQIKILSRCKSLVAGVTLYGGPRACSLLGFEEADSLHHEYNSLSCTIEIVDDVHAAIDHIHEHGRYIIFFPILWNGSAFLFSAKFIR